MQAFIEEKGLQKHTGSLCLLCTVASYKPTSVFVAKVRGIEWSSTKAVAGVPLSGGVDGSVNVSKVLTAFLIGLKKSWIKLSSEKR